MSYVSRLKKEYSESITKKLMESHGLKNVMEVPKLKKIVISKGLGAEQLHQSILHHLLEPRKEKTN